MVKRGLMLLWLGIFLSIILRTYFILNGSEVADVHSLFEMADLYLRGINPYLALNYNAYPPLAIYLEAFAIHLSKISDIPFYITTKILPNIADILICLLLYRFLVRRGVSGISASIWSLIFILNPISILISSAHGQIDSIPSLFILLAIYLLSFNISGLNLFLSALLLGLSFAIKPNTLMLLPLFVLVPKVNFKEKALFLITSLAPLGLLFWGFIAVEPRYVLGKVFNYSGAVDFGFVAILRGLEFLYTGDFKVPVTSEVLQADKIFFLLMFSLLVLIYRNTKNIGMACLAAYLLFLGIYFGISAQYLAWILPLAVLQRDKIIVAYSLFGTIAIVGFYLFLNPTILMAQFSSIKPFQQQFMIIYLIGNSLLLTVILFWLIRVLKQKWVKV